MKVSILTPDVSHNCLARAWLLAEMLKARYDVEIVGPMFGIGVWEPLSGRDDIRIKAVRFGNGTRMRNQLKPLAGLADGDVVYASKLLFSSYVVGLYKKFFDHRPLLLDVDDWEMGFNYHGRNEKKWLDYACEKLAFLADDVTVSNRFLQKKFGGTLVPHARDGRVFDPTRYSKVEERREIGLPSSAKVVMFAGTPKQFKGVEDLIAAVGRLNDPGVCLATVGMGADAYSKELIEEGRATLGNRFQSFGIQPFERFPAFLAAADVVVAPQRKNYATVGQVPSKVFDAMAMAKPLIVTNVSDLPEIVDGCGWVVEPENVPQLAETIGAALSRPDDALENGRKARERFEKTYSYDVVQDALFRLFKKYE